MAKNVYQIMFDNGNAVTFDSTVDVDLHKIGMTQYGAGSLAFDDMFINLQHVVYISKEEKDKQNKSCINCKHYSDKNGIYNCTCLNGVCGLDNKNWEAKE